MKIRASLGSIILTPFISIVPCAGWVPNGGMEIGDWRLETGDWRLNFCRRWTRMDADGLDGAPASCRPLEGGILNLPLRVPPFPLRASPCNFFQSPISNL